jgi:hypothetical protein
MMVLVYMIGPETTGAISQAMKKITVNKPFTGIGYQ